MIKHLDGEFETVDFADDKSILIYDNNEEERYPLHWHNAVEMILPLVNPFEAVCDSREYLLEERDLLVIPAGTLHSLNTHRTRRLILLADNRCFADNPALEDLQPVLSAPVHIRHSEDRELCSQLSELIARTHPTHRSHIQ